jgi:hypothetical protein
MFLETENIAAVESNALKNTISVEQSVIEHGNLGVSGINKFPIEVNFHTGPSYGTGESFVQSGPQNQIVFPRSGLTMTAPRSS